MKFNVTFLFFVFGVLMFGQTGTPYDCFSVYTFSAATNQTGQDNASSAAPCNAWAVTYTTTGFSSVTVKFQTSPDNSSWSDVTNSICNGSTVQPPCVAEGANPIAAGVQGSGKYRAYGKYVRVSVSSVTGTGSGQVVTYGYRGTTASAALGGTGGGSSGTNTKWVDVTMSPYSAICDGVQDDTTAIQAALDSVGSADSSQTGAGSVFIPAGKTCKTTATLNINNSYVTFFGVGLGMAQAVIKTTSTTTDILKINGAGTGNCAAGAIYWPTIKTIDFRRFTPATAGNGISVIKGCWTKIEDVQAVDSMNNFYVQLSGVTLITRVQSAWSTNPGTARNGIFIDSSSGGHNASTRLKSVTLDGTSGTNLTGVNVSGDCIADTFMDDVETAGGAYGIRVTSTAANTETYNYCQGDVRITTPVIDNSSTVGIQVNDVWGGGTAHVGIVAGFVGALTGNAIDIENSQNISVMGMQLRAIAGTAVLLNGTHALFNSVIGNTIQISPIGVSLVNSSVNQILSNMFWSTSLNPATTHISIGGSTAGNIVSQNVLEGYATTGILLGASAAGNTAWPNIIDTTHIGTAVTDNGSGNLTAGITASGTACTITAMIQGVITAATCTP